MKLSYSAAWDDMTDLLRLHGALIVALAGVFIFLPTLLLGYLLAPPVVTDPAQLLPKLAEFYRANWYWFILTGVVAMVGVLAVLLLIFQPRGTSVGGAIAGAVALAPFYFLATLIVGFMLGIAASFLIVPALYLFARAAPIGPVMVAERIRNPIDAIRRMFEVTKGNGWRILGFFLLVAVAGWIATGVASLLAGILFAFVAGGELARLLTHIVSSAASAALQVAFILLYAAVYRQLAGNLAGQRAAETFE